MTIGAVGVVSAVYPAHARSSVVAVAHIIGDTTGTTELFEPARIVPAGLDAASNASAVPYTVAEDDGLLVNPRLTVNAQIGRAHV